MYNFTAAHLCRICGGRIALYDDRLAQQSPVTSEKLELHKQACAIRKHDFRGESEPLMMLSDAAKYMTRISDVVTGGLGQSGPEESSLLI